MEEFNFNIAVIWRTNNGIINYIKKIINKYYKHRNDDFKIIDKYGNELETEQIARCLDCQPIGLFGIPNINLWFIKEGIKILDFRVDRVIVIENGSNENYVDDFMRQNLKVLKFSPSY